jgi:hypothetical protein
MAMNDSELKVFLVRRASRLSSQVETFGTMWDVGHRWYHLACKYADKRGWEDVLSALKAVWLFQK